MADLFDIRRVEIGPENLVAYVRIADDAPLMTSEDLEGTTRVYQLLPHIVEHACVGDAGDTFREAMGDTELAHLLEHVTVELLAQTNLAGDITSGRTWVDEVEDRTFQMELACPDDVLVAAALSCGVWIMDWAYNDGGDPAPDIDAIVAGLVNLVESVGSEGEDLVVDYPVEHDEDDIEEEETAEEDDDADDALDDLDKIPELEDTQDPPRPLWTPAPDVSQERVYRNEPREPEMEAEVDQIMASFGTPSIHDDEQ